MFIPLLLLQSAGVCGFRSFWVSLPLEVLVAQGLTTRVSGMLSGWMASFPLCPNVSYTGNRFIASLA